MYNGLRVSFVIPCYNEEKGIRSVLESPPDVVDEIIVVDNNSTDEIAKAASEMGAKVVLEKRQGYGAACKRGFMAASGDIITTLDGDGMYPIQELLYLIKTLEEEGLDFITVRRKPDRMRNIQREFRYMGVIALNFFIYTLFGIRLLDSQSGMWVFRRRILDELNLNSDGWPFSEEIKIEAFTNRRLRAREIDRIYHDKRIGTSKLNLLHDGFRNLLFLFKKRFGTR